MAEMTVICASAVVMAALYTRTQRPFLYAFFNTAAGLISFAASGIMFSGGLEGVTSYSAALPVILGVPGTVAHRLIEMM